MSFSQETIKVRQAVSTKYYILAILIGAIFLLGMTENDGVEEVVIPNISIEKEKLTLNALEGKWYYNSAPFSGYAVTYYENGQLREKIGFAHGKRQGQASKWFEDGTFSSQKNYVENRLEGVAKTWWPNGQQSTESNYKNRQRHGAQKKWYPNGQLARFTRFNQGREDGLQQAWLRTGKLYANYEVKNGRFFGLKRSNLCYQLKDEVVQK